MNPLNSIKSFLQGIGGGNQPLADPKSSDPAVSDPLQYPGSPWTDLGNNHYQLANTYNVPNQVFPKQPSFLDSLGKYLMSFGSVGHAQSPHTPQIQMKMLPGIGNLFPHPEDSASPTPTPTSSPSWDDFKNSATAIAKQEGFPANVLLGQAAIETGRGTSPMAKGKNNYFGYQAYDNNPNAAAVYKTPEDSIKSYINLIKTDPRYERAWANRNNPVKMIQAIKDAGYASDPNYVEKVVNTPEFNQ